MIYSKQEQEEFKKCQQLAYQCVLEIAQELKEGWTEHQTAQLMDTYLRDHGVRTFFHTAFAWFGERSRFEGFTKYSQFMPSGCRLKSTDVVILDVAPIWHSYAADIGYTLSLEPHPGLEVAKQCLRELRKKIPDYFMSTMNTSEIWKQLDSDLKKSGFNNIHQMYPFSVIGHRLHRIPLSWLPPVVRPFSAQTYMMFLSRGVFPELLGPKRTGSKVGLWALEPHLGGKGFGAKFEEILVVENETKAYWLDDEVPHK